MKKFKGHSHFVSLLSHTFYIKHSQACRRANPKGKGGNPKNPLGGYFCECDFYERIEAKVFAVAFDGESV